MRCIKLHFRHSIDKRAVFPIARHENYIETLLHSDKSLPRTREILATNWNSNRVASGSQFTATCIYVLIK